tara:strand:- start:1569 stop:2396 length:828 start_codon:yes stop_codon:yes gene_type:complete
LDANTDKFSVLIPVYFKDDPIFFNKALHSIFTIQTAKPSEIIIVVDGPVGEGLQLVIDEWKNLKGELVNICQLPMNIGCGKALQKGLKECKFELVARMDSDDISRENRFEDQLSLFAAEPDLVICGSNVSEFNDDSEHSLGERKLPERSVEISKFAIYRNPINHPTVMFKRKQIMEVGGYLDMPFFEDYYLWIRCIIAGFAFKNIQKNLVHMRADKSHLSRRFGLNYAKHEYIFLNRIREIRFLNFGTFFLLVLTRCSIRLAPKSLIKKIYSILR